MNSRQEPDPREAVLGQIMGLAASSGGTDQHRALTYLAVRYPLLFKRATERDAQGFTLSSVQIRAAPAGGHRSMVDVIFAWTHRTTGITDQERVPVDVTGLFPFVVTELSPYIGR